MKRQHENVECVCEKISRKKLDFSVLCVMFVCIQEAATHDITRSPAEIVGSNPPGAWIFVCCECRVLSGRGLCDELITRPEES